MHFDKIANRIRNRTYKTKEEFVRDVKLIRDNAVTYNQAETGGKFGNPGRWWMCLLPCSDFVVPWALVDGFGMSYCGMWRH